MNAAEFRDVMMEAEAELGDIVAETLEEWQRPDRLLQLAMNAATMPPDRWALVPPGDRSKILEVFDGKKGR